MALTLKPTPNVQHARDIQWKFEIYLLGLVFTLLALAVQTAKLGGGTWPALLEISGWLSLLVSGLSGLSRVEWLPVIHQV